MKSFNNPMSKVILISHFIKEGMRHSEVKQIAQGQIAGKDWILNSNPSSLALESMALGARKYKH